MISSIPWLLSGPPRFGPLRTRKTWSVTGSAGRLRVEVAGEGGEEPRGDRHDPLVPALALGDEQPAFADLDITQAQAEHLAAAQPAEQHRLHHRPVAVGAQRRHQRVYLGREQDPRQHPWGPQQRRPPPSRAGAGASGRHPMGHRVDPNPAIPARDEVVEQPGQGGQAPLDGAYRQPGLAVLQAHHPRPAARRLVGP